ncbi:hypothetical protein TM48_03870 [Mycobacterium shottsii]|nr:hypothetical protein TM48_03870 [Mycobacterium shottsii]
MNNALMDYIWRLSPGPGISKSERHQRAGGMRHETHVPERGA